MPFSPSASSKVSSCFSSSTISMRPGLGGDELLDLGHDQLDDLARLQDRVGGLHDVGEDGQPLAVVERRRRARRPAAVAPARRARPRGAPAPAARRGSPGRQARGGSRSPARASAGRRPRRAARETLPTGWPGSASRASAHLPRRGRWRPSSTSAPAKRGDRGRPRPPRVGARTRSSSAALRLADGSAERPARRTRPRAVTGLLSSATTTRRRCSRTPPLRPVARMTTTCRAGASSKRDELVEGAVGLARPRAGRSRSRWRPARCAPSPAGCCRRTLERSMTSGGGGRRRWPAPAAVATVKREKSEKPPSHAVLVHRGHPPVVLAGVERRAAPSGWSAHALAVLPAAG